MLKISPFSGIRFDTCRAPLSRALCPPYDVISAKLQARLRRGAANAIHLELPEGEGAKRYKNALATWRRWRAQGILAVDAKPAFYVVEQTFKLEGKTRRRVGLLAALGLDPASARRVLAHEKTLSKPKKDRTRLLKALKVNTSPIFGIYTDPARTIMRILDAARRTKPAAAGTDIQGVAHRLWKVDDPALTARLSRAFRAKKLLIADGHHRYEVARNYWERTRRPGAQDILAYLCAEEDPGLIVFPTHRVLAMTGDVERGLRAHCVAKAEPGFAALDKALKRASSPYAFGLCNGRFQLMLPAPGDRGVKSRFGTDWLSRRLLGSVDAHDIRYFHDAKEAWVEARRARAAALLVKPFSVSAIRQAVQRAGLLPQKSTYFIPKISTGLVFRAHRP